MLEVEVKASVPDVETLRTRLRELGARRRGVERQRDEYFRHPRRDFRRTDEALRLRFERGQRRRAELTYKGPKLDARTKSRAETTIATEARFADRLLAALGFRPGGVVAKRRERWTWRGLTIAVDEVEGLGAYAEVEKVVDAPPASAAFRSARDECVRAMRLLGLRGSERRSYLELLDQRRRKR